MTPTLSNAADRANLSSLYNPWYFSHCSVNAIDNLVDTLTSTVASNDVSTPPNCFRTESDPIPEFLSTSNIIAGQAYPANVQCQMIYGPDSRVCHARSFGNTSDICTSMYCYDPSEITASGEAICKEHLAAEGTSCGDRKWCQRGRCVASENAPVIGDCPYGDEVTILKTQLGDYKCSELIDMFGKSQCYDPETERTCCGSCGRVRRDSQVCPYGDRAEDCSKSRCHQVFSDGKTYAADYCCETCSYNGCADVTEIDGVTCDVRVQQDGFQGCYNDTVAYHCCKTCTDLRTNKPDCQYGDRILGSYCSINGTQDQRAQKCADRDDVCCESCQGAGSATHLQWTSPLTTVMLTIWFYWNSVTGM